MKPATENIAEPSRSEGFPYGSAGNIGRKRKHKYREIKINSERKNVGPVEEVES